MISSRGGRNRSSWRSSRGWLIGLPRQRISPSKESRTAQIGNPKPQENPHAHPAFLQNRLLAQVKSSRSINRFLILHGRLTSPRRCAEYLDWRHSPRIGVAHGEAAQGGHPRQEGGEGTAQETHAAEASAVHHCRLGARTRPGSGGGAPNRQRPHEQS